MRVLVVAAMRSELRAFRRRAPVEADVDVATGVLGIGMALARASTQRLLDEHDPGHVLVVGVAGGIGPTTAVGDLVVPEVVLDGATGREHRPAPVAGFTNRGTLHTSDHLVGPAEAPALVERGVVALDMETASVAAVCEAREVPWSVLRGISDHADDPVDPAVLGMVGPEGEPKPLGIAAYLARRPHRVPQLVRLSRGLDAATAASAGAAVEAIAQLHPRSG